MSFAQGSSVRVEPPKAPGWSEGGKATDKHSFGAGSGQLTVAPKLSGSPGDLVTMRILIQRVSGGASGSVFPPAPDGASVLDTERTHPGWEGLARTQQVGGGVGVAPDA